jgi:hypothetical protein
VNRKVSKEERAARVSQMVSWKVKVKKYPKAHSLKRSHDSSMSLFFETIEVDATCLLGLSFLIELDVWSSKGDIAR